MLTPELRKILTDNLDSILLLKEVARFLRVTPMTVYRMIYAGTLIAYKNEEGEWQINRSDLLDYLDRSSNL